MLSKVLLAIAITCTLIGCLTSKSEKLSRFNQPPSYQNISNQLLEAGELLSIELNAMDPEGNPLNYSIYNMPSWLSLDPATGTISGTPSLEDVGLYENIRIDISDGNNITSVGPFFIQVEEELFDININWEQVTEDINNDTINNVAGYKIYIEEASARFNSSITVKGATETSFIIKRLAPSTYTFTMTAYLTSGLESDKSAEQQFIL